MNLLITGALPKDETFFRELEKMGHSITFVQDERIPLKEQNIDPSRFEGVICNGLFLYNDIGDFSSLKYIQLTSAGLDRVPMDYVKSHDIEIHNARGVYSIPMAEFALCGVLQLYKQSRFFYDNQKERKWEKRRDLLELNGKTVCIVGCGSVGTECAKRFKAFGCEVLGVDLAVREDCNYDNIVSFASLDETLGKSDVTVLTLPLTDETFHLFDEKRFSKMKRNSVIVNIARGAVIETSSLVRALETNLLGAVLDVFEEEPLPANSPLWNMENVIITPHNSFVGEGNVSRITNLVWDFCNRLK